MIGTNRNGFFASAQALGISIATAFSLCALPGPAAAEAKFDGYWSVDVVAVDGTCDALTIAIEVTDGEVTFAGFGATAEGAIGSNGLLHASIKQGGSVVRAKGALKGDLGRGSWTSSECTGQWTARRG